MSKAYLTKMKIVSASELLGLIGQAVQFGGRVCLGFHVYSFARWALCPTTARRLCQELGPNRVRVLARAGLTLTLRAILIAARDDAKQGQRRPLEAQKRAALEPKWPGLSTLRHGIPSSFIGQLCEAHAEPDQFAYLM